MISLFFIGKNEIIVMIILAYVFISSMKTCRLFYSEKVVQITHLGIFHVEIRRFFSSRHSKIISDFPSLCVDWFCCSVLWIGILINYVIDMIRSNIMCVSSNCSLLFNNFFNFIEWLLNQLIRQKQYGI